MKRFVCIAALLALAAAAQAQTIAPAHKIKVVAPPKRSAVSLRPSQNIAPSIQPAPVVVASGASPAPFSSTGADPGQCRAACAHSYYFCMAGEDAPSCPQSWMSCQVACENAALASR